MLSEQARQVARADAQSCRERTRAVAIESARLDQDQGALDGCPGTLPRRAERSCFGPAAQARSIAGALRRCRGWIEANIARKRGTRRTHRTAVYPRRSDGNEHHAVQGTVASLQSFILSAEIKHLAAILGSPLSCEIHLATTSENDRS